jgi:predicted dehydrogenase
MTGAKLRIGIAGFGVVGKRRHSFIDAHPALETVAVCDRTFAAGGTLEGGVRCHTRYADLLAEPLDAVFVCMTNDIAPEVTVAGLEKGLHVFCEKPPGRNVADVERVRTCEARHPGLKLMYGFNHRYHDSVREALRIMRSAACSTCAASTASPSSSVSVRIPTGASSATPPAAASCSTRASTWSI